MLLFCQWVTAQQVRVYDLDTREPLGNVAIYNEDRSQTAITYFNGRANLSQFKRKERLTFNLYGYQLKRLTKAQVQNRNMRVYLEMSPQQLDEVVMSISKWEQQKKDIPQKVASISAREIAFAQPQTSADLLQQSGQVYVQKSQLGGGSPMVRGFATNRLLLTVDGVRMNNAIFRGGNIQNVISVDPYTVRNTEVIFGPGSVIYGSDAIGGVLNFYTREPVFSQGDSLITTGNVGYRFASANGEHTTHADLSLANDKWGFLSSVSFNSFDDLRMGAHGPDDYLRPFYQLRQNGQDVLVNNPDPEVQVPTGYNQVNLMQKVAYKPNVRWDYKLGVHYSRTTDYPRYDRLVRPAEESIGLQSGDWFYGPQEWLMANLQIAHQGRNKFYDGVRVTAAYQQFMESRNSRDFGMETLYNTREKVDAFSANLDFENKKIGDLRLYYGLEYVHNRVGSDGSERNIDTDGVVDAPSRYPDGSTWQTAAGYINAEYQAKPNFTLLTGMRYSHVWVDAEFDNTFYNFPFRNTEVDNGALTLSIGTSWFPRENLQITLNGSTGFRSPNIDDIGKVFDSEPGSVVVPNPDLEPEYAYNAEVGVIKNFNDRVFLKGAAFYTYLVDALVRRDFEFNGQSQIVYQGELSDVQAIQNAAKAYVYGFEFGLEAFFTDQWSFRGNLTITEGTEEDDNGVETAARHAAPTFADAHLVYRRQSFKADLFLNYNGEIPFGDLALSERAKPFLYARDAAGNPFSPSWYTLNLRTQYRFSNAWWATATLENITNQRYRTYSSGIAAPGRNLVLGLRYSW